MRLVSVVSEAFRNLVSGTSRAAQWCVILALCLGSLSAVEGVQIATIEGQVTAFRSAGADILATPAEGLVDGAACDRLSDIDGIQSAGAVAQGDYLSLPSAPDTPIQTYVVTPGLGRLLGVADPGRVGVWMTPDQAGALGLNVGDIMETSDGSLRLAGLFNWPQDGRDSRFRYAALIPAQRSSRLFDECWARSWPQRAETESLLLATVTTTPGGKAQQPVQLNATLGLKLDAHSLFQNRFAHLTVLFSVLIGGVIGLVSSRTRRLEFASSLHIGQTHLGLGLTVAVEALIWVSLAALLAVDALWLIVRQQAPTEVLPIFLIAAKGIGLGAGAAFLGAVLAAAATQEKHLFKYFKQR